MKKVNVFILVSLILATILGFYGQSISYFLNEHVANIRPIYYLTALTIISIVLFFTSFMVAFYQWKNKKDNALIYQLLILLVGIVTSSWSLFVLIMWWG